MQTSRKLFNGGVLVLSSVILGSLTWILAGVPLRGLRLLVGAPSYWALTIAISGAALALQWWLFAICYLAMAVTIGLFAELEERGHSLATSGFYAVITTVLMMAGAFSIWIAKQGGSWQTMVLGKVESYLNAIPGWTEAIRIEARDVALQTPSLVIAVLILGLFLALVCQPRLRVLNRQQAQPNHRLTNFAVPEVFIWVLIAGLAGAFVKTDIAWINPVAVNLLNISAVVFFLQGLAVVVRYLGFFRISWLWQILLLVILVSQLFILVSVLGLADYWLNFRARLSRRSPGMDREIYKK